MAPIRQYLAWIQNILTSFFRWLLQPSSYCSNWDFAEWQSGLQAMLHVTQHSQKRDLDLFLEFSTPSISPLSLLFFFFPFFFFHFKEVLCWKDLGKYTHLLEDIINLISLFILSCGNSQLCSFDSDWFETEQKAPHGMLVLTDKAQKLMQQGFYSQWEDALRNFKQKRNSE